MGLFKMIARMARESNDMADDRWRDHKKEVSDGRCIHCYWCETGYSKRYRCSKHDIELTEDEVKEYGCDGFSEKDISFWKI